MRIAGRLAVEADTLAGGWNRSLIGYHGCDVVVRHISEQGFSADFRHALPSGTIVRLRLAGAGTMVARVSRSEAGSLEADFVNPLNRARLCKTIGFSDNMRTPAFA